MGLNYDISHDLDSIKINLVGDLDAYTSVDFKQDVFRNLNIPKDIIIDATKLDFIDSTGLGSLISIYNKVREKNTITINNLKPNVEKIFIITELNKVFIITE